MKLVEADLTRIMTWMKMGRMLTSSAALYQQSRRHCTLLLKVTRSFWLLTTLLLTGKEGDCAKMLSANFMTYRKAKYEIWVTRLLLASIFLTRQCVESICHVHTNYQMMLKTEYGSISALSQLSHRISHRIIVGVTTLVDCTWAHCSLLVRCTMSTRVSVELKVYKRYHPSCTGTIFSTEFNLGFGSPKSDTCSTCDKKGEMSEADMMHVRRKDLGYEMQAQDKSCAVNASDEQPVHYVTFIYKKHYPCQSSLHP